jgi:hypothetical protein
LNFSATTPAGTSLTVDVLDANGGVLAAQVANDTDLGALPAVASQTSIKLRANLTTTSFPTTPTLLDWSVAWQTAPDNLIESAWSNEQISTQDNVVPVLSVTSPARTALASYTLAGVASDSAGVPAVTVNGATAATNDNFAHWSRPSTLAYGVNNFTIVAQDGAVPPNTTTKFYTVIYDPADADGDGLPDAWEAQYGVSGALGDPDRDGLSNLAECAMGLDPNTADALPPPYLVTDSSNGKKYLTWQYRRLLNSGLLTYVVEASDDLIAWHADAAWVQEIGVPVPNGDGITETVTVRALPAIDGASRRYLHLRVATP